MDDDPGSTAGHRSAVPSYLTRFIGREREAEILVGLLADPEVRWVTLTGPGGVGKTRLAIESIAQLRAARADVPPIASFVPLFGIANIQQALNGIARELDGTAHDTDPLVTIRNVADGRRLYLLLDNADGLASASAELAALLHLPGCEQLTLVVTSRTPFDYVGEHLLPVNPLPLPDLVADSPTNLRTNPAVSLFLDRARAARSDLSFNDREIATIATICRRLDGLPLAVELTASRLRQLSLTTIAARLEESRFSLDGATVPHELPGHVALRDSIASSFDLLDEAEREFLLRLSVFTGGVSLETGRRMAAGYNADHGYPFADGYGLKPGAYLYFDEDQTTDSPEVQARGYDLEPLQLDPEATLERLVNQSLLQRTFDSDGETRYQFLETINEFARAELAASGGLEAANHARMRVIMALAEAAHEGLWVGHRRVVPIERLDAELTNLRPTLEWMLDQGDDAADLMVRGADLLATYFRMRGMLPEAVSWLTRALALNGAKPYRRINGLNQLGFAHWMCGEDDRARQVLHESLDLVSGRDYPSPEARCRFYLALVAWRGGPEAAMEAVGHLQEALRLFPIWDDGIGIGVCKLALGEVVRTSGDSAGATRLFEEALEQFDRDDYAWGTATALWFLGEAARADGDERRAADFMARGLTAYQQTGDRLGVAGCVGGIAALLAARQDWAMAARFFGAASSLREYTSSFLPPTHESDHETIATLVVQTIGPDEFLAGRNGDHAATVAEALRIAKAIAAGKSTAAVPFINVKKPTRARRQVLALLLEGKDIKEIAAALNRGVSTVYRHRDELLEAYGCQTVEELRRKFKLSGQPSDEA